MGIQTSLLYHSWTCIAHPASQRAWLPSQRYQTGPRWYRLSMYQISRTHLIGYLVDDGITSSVHAKHTFSRTSIMLRVCVRSSCYKPTIFMDIGCLVDTLLMWERGAYSHWRMRWWDVGAFWLMTFCSSTRFGMSFFYASSFSTLACFLSFFAIDTLSDGKQNDENFTMTMIK